MSEKNQNSMKEINSIPIRYKYIEHERTEDAPFIGALICSIICDFNCKNCFNQYWKSSEIFVKCSHKIIKEIKDNPFNEGIILSGLEWSNQPQELRNLLYFAKKSNLKTCLYTGLETVEAVGSILNFKYLDFLKTGKYNKELGGLNSPLTNQRFYDIIHKDIGIHEFTDTTYRFQPKGYLE